MRNIPVFTFEKSQNQKEQKTAMLLYCRCLATHASDSPQGFMPIKASPPSIAASTGYPASTEAIRNPRFDPDSLTPGAGIPRY